MGNGGVTLYIIYIVCVCVYYMMQWLIGTYWVHLYCGWRVWERYTIPSRFVCGRDDDDYDDDYDYNDDDDENVDDCG